MNSETIELKKQNVQKAYDNANNETKRTLADLVPEMFGDIKQRVKTIDDVFAIVRANPSKYLPNGLTLEQYTVHPAAVIELIASVLNEGWEADYSDKNQTKYYPWFIADKNAPLGFSFYGYDYVITLTDLGARLAFKSRELAEYAGKTFITEYSKFLNKNK